MLSWGEIKEMRRCGVTFGAHTLTHPDLTRLPLAQAQAEICGSKEIIENALGEPANCFAYPFGRYDQRAARLSAVTSCARVRTGLDCSAPATTLMLWNAWTLIICRVKHYLLHSSRLVPLLCLGTSGPAPAPAHRYAKYCHHISTVILIRICRITRTPLGRSPKETRPVRSLPSRLRFLHRNYLSLMRRVHAVYDKDRSCDAFRSQSRSMTQTG